MEIGGKIRNIILDLCGGTGAWSKPYKDAGFEVVLVTLPELNIYNLMPTTHWICLRDASHRQIRYSDIFGVLAAPPCTEFSVAKNSRPRNLQEGMRIVRRCLELIWCIQGHNKLEFWALENPRGLLRQFLGRPAYTFEQWQFGTPAVKATDIWGVFKQPKPTVKERPEIPMYGIKNYNYSKAISNPPIPPEYAEYINSFKSHTERRAAARAITPAGFADAFFRANH